MTAPYQPMPGEEPDNPESAGLSKHHLRTNDNWYPPSDLSGLDELDRQSTSKRFGSGRYGHSSRRHPADLELSRYETYVDNPDNNAGMITNTKELERFLMIAMNNGMPEEERAKIMAEYLETNRRNAMLSQTNREFDIDKKRKWLNFKMIVGTVVILMLVLFVLVFTVLFVWLAVNKGLLSEGSFIDGVFTTIQQVLKIILTSG